MQVGVIQFRFFPLAISDAVVKGLVESLINLLICVCVQVSYSFLVWDNYEFDRAILPPEFRYYSHVNLIIQEGD